jgi:membrane protein YqaA with SNARE-associated domain
VEYFSAWVLSFVTSPIGIVILAFLDSTLLFSMPGGIDAAVVALAARQNTGAWAVALFATAGSLAGAMLTYWMGVKIGEHGLEHYVPAKRLARIRARVRNVGAIQLAVLDLIPPPFPFTPFILAAGALEVDAATFFSTLAACRIVRFGGEMWLAAIYGRRIVEWFDSDTFRNIVVGFSVIAVALTIVSIVKLLRSTRSSRSPARQASAKGASESAG